MLRTRSDQIANHSPQHFRRVLSRGTCRNVVSVSDPKEEASQQMSESFCAFLYHVPFRGCTRSKLFSWSSCCGSAITNTSSIHEDVASLSGLRICHCRELWWLWCRPAAAAPVRPQAWELPYAAGIALKNLKKKGQNCFHYQTKTVLAFFTLILS